MDNSRINTTATPSERCPSEQTAHAILTLVADHPGSVGKLRCARIVGGFSVPGRREQERGAFAGYAVAIDWRINELTALVEALICGKLVMLTIGPQPTLVLSRSGHHALDALDGIHAGETI